jgi:circadian clock protein KaiC
LVGFGRKIYIDAEFTYLEVVIVTEKASTGIKGLDTILKGGFIRGRAYLIKGGPGTGKTLFGLHFLAEGVKNSEKVVYISLDENVEEIKEQGRAFNLPVDEIEFVDMMSSLTVLTPDIVFWDTDSKAEVFEFIDSIDKVSTNADRVFIDGVGVISEITKDLPLYRRILSTIINRVTSSNTTLLLSCEIYREVGRDVVSYLVSGEIVLERLEKSGNIFRILRLLKYRGDAYIGDYYYDIMDGKLELYPTIPQKHEKVWNRELISTGNEQLDRMLGGGIYRGSNVIICGKTGVGKTNICLQILTENDRRGEKGVLYALDEHKDVIVERIDRLFNYNPKNLVIRERSEFTNIGKLYNTVVNDFKELRPSVVVIDSINILDQLSVSGVEVARILTMLRDLIVRSGGVMINVVETHGSAEEFVFTGHGLSHLCDYMIFGRHIEFEGEIQKAIVVIKNRFGNHERSFRLLDIEDGKGLKIGEPLKGYRGHMRGVFEKR